VEGVEDELAGETQQVQGPPAVLGQERAGGGEVLAQHDLRRLDGTVLLRAVPIGQSPEGRFEIPLLLGRVSGLSQLIAARVAQGLDPVPQPGIGVIPKPVRWFHDVGVGIVNDPSRHGVVRRDVQVVRGRGHRAPVSRVCHILGAWQS
jgi:hypothetical protein